MNRTGTVWLEFDPDLNKLRKDKKLWDGLSAVVQIGDTLWVANDEALSLERLSRQGETDAGAIRYANHEQFPLRDFLNCRRRLSRSPPIRRHTKFSLCNKNFAL